MSTTELIVFHIAVPFASGLIFCIYFLYFLLTKNSGGQTYRYYLIFLLSFAVYLSGRPVQLLAGGGYLPLIINNLRLFLLCALSMPSLLLMTGFLKNRNIPYKKELPFILGAILGISYAVFNTFGSDGSFIIFHIGRDIPYYNIRYVDGSPWHAKDVISVIQAAVGFILVAGSLAEIIRKKAGRPFRTLFGDNVFYIDAGISVFGFSFLIGSLMKQWAVSYIGSVSSAVIIGAGVFSEIKRLNDQVEKFNFDKLKMIQDEFMRNAVSSISVASDAGNDSTGEYSGQAKCNSLIENAKKYIQMNYPREISAEDAADSVGLSRSYFLRLFKDNTGITFVDYLTNVRILKAKELLLKTDSSITDIAYETGFNDSNYFSRVFSSATAMSPRQFRKQALKKQSF
jgi:AraC-like DNA-binding protein